MATTKKKSKETKEFEEQFEEPETPKSPKAAQETRRQEFKGPFSSKTEELCNNLLTAKQGRTTELHAFMGDVHEFIAATKDRVRELGEETHDFLRSAEHNRIRGFKDFMGDTKGRIKELNQETRGFLKTSKRNRIKEFNGFMAECRGFIAGTQAAVKALGQETHNMLKCFESENKGRAHDFRAAHNIWLKFGRELSRVH
ncbi:MAG: hypothetical protein Q6359_11250 [Candidatus Brocadiales bacterium]|nr:hypothetical protein [Candidatus Brocadiales bacterium]